MRWVNWLSESWGRKHITFYAAIWRFSIFNGGSSNHKSNNSPSHSASSIHFELSLICLVWVALLAWAGLFFCGALGGARPINPQKKAKPKQPIEGSWLLRWRQVDWFHSTVIPFINSTCLPLRPRRNWKYILTVPIKGIKNIQKFPKIEAVGL